MNLLQRAAAADPEVLKRYPAERSRYTGMGGALLFTAFLAFVSGSVYAFDFLHAALPLALLFGLAWGAGIFNLDRWMLTATRRQDKPWKTLLMAVPRIALALLMGFVIAEPVLLRVFHEEVKHQAAELKEVQHEKELAGINAKFSDIKDLETKVTALEGQLTPAVGAAVENNPRYKTLTAEYNTLNAQLAQARADRDRAHGLLRDNRAKVVRTLRTQVHDKRVEMQDLRRELQSAEDAANKTKIATASAALGLVQQRLAQRQTERQGALKYANDHYQAGETGLMERVEALGALTRSSSATALYTWMLRLFIIFVDLVPIVFKVLSLVGRKSPAERDEDQREEIQLKASKEDAEHELERERFAQKDRDIIARRESEKLVTIAKDRVDQEIEEHKKLNAQIVAVQVKIAQEYIDAWEAAALAALPGMLAQANGANGRRALLPATDGHVMRTQLPFTDAVAVLAAERGLEAGELADVERARAALELPPGYFVEERIDFILDAVSRDPTTRDLVYTLLTASDSLAGDDVPVAPAAFARLAVLVGGDDALLAALEDAVDALRKSAAYRLVRADLEAAPQLVADFLAAADDVPATAVVLILGDDRHPAGAARARGPRPPGAVDPGTAGRHPPQPRTRGSAVVTVPAVRPGAVW